MEQSPLVKRRWSGNKYQHGRTSRNDHLFIRRIVFFSETSSETPPKVGGACGAHGEEGMGNRLRLLSSSSTLFFYLSLLVFFYDGERMKPDVDAICYFDIYLFTTWFVCLFFFSLVLVREYSYVHKSTGLIICLRYCKHWIIHQWVERQRGNNDDGSSGRAGNSKT